MKTILFTAFLAVSSSSLMAQAPAPAPSAPSAKLGSRVWVWDELVAKPNNVGARREVVDLPTATFEKFESHVTTLNPGVASHPPHRHSREEFILLKEGNLDVFVAGKTHPAGPGSVFFFAANDLHNMRNVGTTPATYLVFNFDTVATRSASIEGATAVAAPGTLVSTVFDWEKLAVQPTPVGTLRKIVDSPTTTAKNFEGHVTTLKAGEVPHASHHHPDEELIVVKEGLMQATINGVAKRGGPGSIFFFASNDEHGMKNVGTTPAAYYVFRIITDATPELAAAAK